MDAEHVDDADEEERVARGGRGNRAGGYRPRGKGKGDKVETNIRCDYCSHMIEGKPYRIYSLGSGIAMHHNCAYWYCDHYSIGDKNIPVFDIPVYSEVVLASMHPDREPASSELDQDRDLMIDRMIRDEMVEEMNKRYKAGRGKTIQVRELRALRWARCGKFCKKHLALQTWRLSLTSTNKARCVVTAVQPHDGEAARAVRTLSALNLEVTPEQQRNIVGGTERRSAVFEQIRQASLI